MCVPVSAPQDFPKLTKDMQKQMESVLNTDIPNLVKQFDNPYF